VAVVVVGTLIQLVAQVETVAVGLVVLLVAVATEALVLLTLAAVVVELLCKVPHQV
jgi:hypothetical protein